MTAPGTPPARSVNANAPVPPVAIEAGDTEPPPATTDAVTSAPGAAFPWRSKTNPVAAVESPAESVAGEGGVATIRYGAPGPTLTGPYVTERIASSRTW